MSTSSYSPEILGVYADAFTTIVKKHDPTRLFMEIFKARMLQFVNLLQARLKDNIDIIQVGSSYDDLHMSRLMDNEDGKTEFFPEIDFDLLMVFIDYAVEDEGNLEQNNDSSTSKEVFAKMVSTSNAGYVKLFVTEKGRDMLKKPGCRISESLTSDFFLLNTAFSSLVNIHTELPNTEVLYSRTEKNDYTLAGPAISRKHESYKSVSYDFVYAFPCKSWPLIAAGWMKRAKSCMWPEESVIERIAQDGCMLVPVSSHESKEPELEWRVSFVKSERLLSSSLSSVQRTCYSVVKLMLKSCLSKESILTSYHMKNIFYYTCEEVGGNQMWTQDKLGEMILKFLKYIAMSLHLHRIPHYFLPPHNLISHCSPESVQSTKKEVESIIKQPFFAILTACRKVACFDIKDSLNKFSSLGGHAQFILAIYVSFVQILWNLGEVNLCTSFAKICFQKIINLNRVSSCYVKVGSGTFTAQTMVDLLKPLAMTYMLQGNVEESLWLFETIEESDPRLVEKTHPDVLTNIACQYANEYAQFTAEQPKKKTSYSKAMEYFKRATEFTSNSSSLHLAFGTFLLDCEELNQAVEQFQLALDVQFVRDDDEAFIEIPGSEKFTTRRMHVPGKIMAYYRLVECLHKLEIFRSRRLANRFETYIETCKLELKPAACQLCGFSMRNVGLFVKASLLFDEAVKYDKALSKKTSI